MYITTATTTPTAATPTNTETTDTPTTITTITAVDCCSRCCYHKQHDTENITIINDYEDNDDDNGLQCLSNSNTLENTVQTKNDSCISTSRQHLLSLLSPDSIRLNKRKQTLYKRIPPLRLRRRCFNLSPLITPTPLELQAQILNKLNRQCITSTSSSSSTCHISSRQSSIMEQPIINDKIFEMNMYSSQFKLIQREYLVRRNVKKVVLEEFIRDSQHKATSIGLSSLIMPDHFLSSPLSSSSSSSSAAAAALLIHNNNSHTMEKDRRGDEQGDGAFASLQKRFDCSSSSSNNGALVPIAPLRTTPMSKERKVSFLQQRRAAMKQTIRHRQKQQQQQHQKLTMQHSATNNPATEEVKICRSVNSPKRVLLCQKRPFLDAFNASTEEEYEDKDSEDEQEQQGKEKKMMRPSSSPSTNLNRTNNSLKDMLFVGLQGDNDPFVIARVSNTSQGS